MTQPPIASLTAAPMTARADVLAALEGCARRAATRLDSVHCADALTLLRALPDNFVDIVVTSPPYNIKWKSRTNYGIYTNSKWVEKFREGYDNYNDHQPEAEYQRWISEVVGECLRVSKGLVWVNHKTRYRDGVGIHPLSFLQFPMWSEVVWNQGSSRTLNSKRFAPSHEYIFGFGRPHYWEASANIALSVWYLVHRPIEDHPAPFPQALIEPLIRASCPPNGIVLVPFLGRGTTALAARDLGRHYIGCDISPVYAETARRNLRNPARVNMFERVSDPMPAQDVQQLALFGAAR